jgi:hypothetical protein
MHPHNLLRSLAAPFTVPCKGSIGNPVRNRNGPAAVSGDKTRNYATGSWKGIGKARGVG